MTPLKPLKYSPPPHLVSTRHQSFAQNPLFTGMGLALSSTMGWENNLGDCQGEIYVQNLEGFFTSQLLS